MQLTIEKAPPPPGPLKAAYPQSRPPTAFPPATHLPFQPVAECERTNEHTNEHTNEQTNQQTNKHDGSQYLLSRVIAINVSDYDVSRHDNHWLIDWTTEATPTKLLHKM